MSSKKDPSVSKPLAHPIKTMSDDSLIASIAQMSGELLRRMFVRTTKEGGIPSVCFTQEIPFSRAEATDYLRIVELWCGWVDKRPSRIPPRGCPACKSIHGRFVFKSYDSYDYHSCQECGAWYVPHAIDDTLIGVFFKTFPEARGLADDMMKRREQRTREGDRTRFGTYFEIIQNVLPADLQPIRYVDIGCGVGHSVDLASERGWDAIGLETSQVAIETARAAARKVFHPNEWETSKKYDVISLFETLEHITDPDPIIAKAASCLARDGLIFITIPNRASLEISILKDKCFHVFGGSENVGHINLLDSTSLGVLMQRHGLKLMYIDGQYGSNLLQIICRLNNDQRSVLDIMKQGRIDLKLPELLYILVNNLGPAISIAERALGLSPILVGVACRVEDQESVAARYAQLRERQHAQVLKLFETV